LPQAPKLKCSVFANQGPLWLHTAGSGKQSSKPEDGTLPMAELRLRVKGSSPHFHPLSSKQTPKVRKVSQKIDHSKHAHRGKPASSISDESLFRKERERKERLRLKKQKRIANASRKAVKAKKATATGADADRPWVLLTARKMLNHQK
jgi:hypothetical protein